MKRLNTKKFGLMMLLGLLLTIQTVASLGIPTPFPNSLRMMRGDTAEFKMQIQAVNEPVSLSCTPYTEGFDPLIITFKEKTVTAEAGETAVLWGTVTIPNNAQVKMYEGTVHASCVPIVGEDTGGSKITKIPGNEWSISVVATAEERNIPLFVTTLPTTEITPAIPTSTIITIIIIIAVLVIGVYYWFEKGKKKKK